MIDYSEVLTRRHKGRLWSMNANDYDQLVMLDGGNKPSRKSLEDAWPEVAEELAALADSRAAAKASALSKLAALGLSEAEVAALLGV